MKTVLLTDAEIPSAEEMYGDIAELRLLKADSITRQNVRDADILIVRSVTKISKDLLEGSKVRFVASVTSGYDHVDIPYLNSKGIKFVYAAGCNSNAVAEYTIAAILVLCNKFGLDLSRTTLGIVGFGNIGTKVARKASSLGIRILRNDPPLQEMEKSTVFHSIDELMISDIITLHVPLTDTGEHATSYLFDEARIRKMKPGSILINTSRGRVIRMQALRDALRSGHLRSAVIDVWENEPEIDLDVLSMAALGTPHIAGYSAEGKRNGVHAVHKAVLEFLSIDKKDKMEEKLPPPKIRKISIHDQVLSSVDLHGIIRECYDIEEDDKKMRSVFNVNPEDRKRYFTELRKVYNPRREFSATTIEINKSSEKSVKCLEELGFSIKFKR